MSGTAGNRSDLKKLDHMHCLEGIRTLIVSDPGGHMGYQSLKGKGKFKKKGVM